MRLFVAVEVGRDAATLAAAVRAAVEHHDPELSRRGLKWVDAGNLHVTLVYRAGDSEFGPAADLLFDACAKRVLCAEDAAWLASRICLGLL